MALPFFYIHNYDPTLQKVVLDEDNSRHIIQVLRMKKDEQINLTNGKGTLLTCTITDDHKKQCIVRVDSRSLISQPERKVIIGISLLKNSNRFEWFLEKATEIGVEEIIPLICERTEKEKFRFDRMQQICISAMLQSQQCRLPLLHKPTVFNQLFRLETVHTVSQKFIAHCIENNKRNLTGLLDKSLPSQIIFIGPEGDFTKAETEMAIANQFETVSLGETRLRTETAGIAAAVILRMEK